MYPANTLMETLMESPILSCTWANLISVYLFWCWVRSRNEVVWISTTDYLINWMVNACQSRHYSVGTEVGATIGEVCPANWWFNTACVSCKLLCISFILAWHVIYKTMYWCTLLDCRSNDILQRQVARLLGLLEECVSKILRRNRDTGRSHHRRRGDRCLAIVRDDRQLIRMVWDNVFSRFLVCSWRWRADCEGRCQFGTF